MSIPRARSTAASSGATAPSVIGGTAGSALAAAAVYVDTDDNDCTGALWLPNVVVTAADCIVGESVPDIQVTGPGNNLNSLEFDQRGAGYPRVTGAEADIGAYEGSIRSPLTSVPTLGTLGLGLLSALLGLAGLAVQRLRRRPSGPD